MSVLALPSYYLSANENYGHHSHNKSLIPDKSHSFHAFDSSFMLIENDDLNFDEFITNCKAINHADQAELTCETMKSQKQQGPLP